MANKLINDISKFTLGMKFGKDLLNKAKFGADYEVVEKEYGLDPLVSIFYTVLLIVALYLAFKCGGKDNLQIIEIILAVLCSPFYIAYRLAIPC